MQGAVNALDRLPRRDSISNAVNTRPKRTLRIVIAVSRPGVTITMSETPRKANDVFMKQFPASNLSKDLPDCDDRPL